MSEDFNNKGNECYKQGDFYGALDCYNKAIAIDKSKAGYYNNRGSVYYEIIEYSKAMDDFNKAIEIGNADFNSNQVYCNIRRGKGGIYRELKQFDDAISEYNKAIELNQDVHSYYDRGYCYYKMKDYQKALNDFDKCIELDPNNEKYQIKKKEVHEKLKMNSYNSSNNNSSNNEMENIKEQLEKYKHKNEKLEKKNKELKEKLEESNQRNKILEKNNESLKSFDHSIVDNIREKYPNANTISDDELIMLRAKLVEEKKRVKELFNIIESKIIEKQNENHKCKICFVRDFNSVIIHCGHALCDNCYNDIAKLNRICPFCKTKIDKVIKIFK